MGKIEFLSFRGICRQRVNRQIRMRLADPVDRLNTVHARHHMVKKHDIEAVILDLFQAFLTAVCRRDEHFCPCKQPLDHRQIHRRVIYDQHLSIRRDKFRHIRSLRHLIVMLLKLPDHGIINDFLVHD